MNRKVETASGDNTAIRKLHESFYRVLIVIAQRREEDLQKLEQERVEEDEYVRVNHAAIDELERMTMNRNRQEGSSKAAGGAANEWIGECQSLAQPEGQLPNQLKGTKEANNYQGDRG